ncbi:hypothetical protein [Paenibacillus sp. GCM10012306]|uniref:hypothetical protein n=1 Tax=Paenibacillus sp. GCM10012306 TaxID=3317342 RepID=UPI00360A43DF
MIKKLKWKKTWQEKYWDGECEYIDERLVSWDWKNNKRIWIDYEQEMKNTYDDQVIWTKKDANSGKFYREPYKKREVIENKNT